MPDQVQLITYADRLGGDLAGLRSLLDGPLAGLFGGVHVLPFYTPFDGADAGFDPDDHTTVDPRLGTWEDIRRLAADRTVMVDVIVNHVSSRAPQFADWREKGSDSEFDGMFLTWDTAFPDGASEADLLRIYRPRPGIPFTPYSMADGTRRLVWTTFTGEQIDIDVDHPASRRYLLSILDKLAATGVSQVRLDAVGYAVKAPGTSCFMTAETFAFIDELTLWCHQRNLTVLVEVHSYYMSQIEIAAKVDLVYDFALPPLILHALTAADAEPLARWLQLRPANAVTVLDTHDGIGVVDVGADAQDRSRAGLLAPEQIDALVTSMHTNSNDTSRQATGAAASNVDLYQVNCTFYDALGGDDAHYLTARAIQFFTPGIPQVYYVGLLAGHNDMDLLRRTNVGRDVNRHYYGDQEIESALATGVVSELQRLIRFRNRHPAFDGELEVVDHGSALEMTRRHGKDWATLRCDLTAGTSTITHSVEAGEETWHLDGE